MHPDALAALVNNLGIPCAQPESPASQSRLPQFVPLSYCGVSVISTVFPPRLIPGMSKLDSAPIWPLYP